MTDSRNDAERLERSLEQHRAGLTAYCDRMLASPFEAEDAVQETLMRAWRSIDGFDGRAALGSWLRRIATNVCLDMLDSQGRRARPLDLGPAQGREPATQTPGPTVMEPVSASAIAPEGDPAEVAVARETVRLAFVTVLQLLPARQRAVLLLCEVLRWKATEVAELLDTTAASVNSALQRARTALDTGGARSSDPPTEIDKAQRGLLARYLQAFQAYDIDALISLIGEDAAQSTPPSDLWPRQRRNGTSSTRRCPGQLPLPAAYAFRAAT